MCRPEFDDKDRELLVQREVKRDVRQNEEKKPEVGDFVQMPNGELLQFTHYWEDDLKGDYIQTTISKRPREDGSIHPCAGDISFYMDRDGFCSFSGSLDKALDVGKLVLSQGKRYGNVWFFHHDQPGAHRAVYAMVQFRIWEYVP